MAMIASDMKDSIKAEMDSVESGSEPSVYASAFDSAVSTYIEDNCEINYSWTATDAVPTPDPTVSFTASLSFPSFTIGNAPSIEAWSLLLQTAIMTAIIVPDDSAFLLPPMIFLLTSPLIIPQSMLTDPDEAMEFACDKIVTWIKLLINPVPVPGTHLTYTIPTPGAIMLSIS